MKQRILALFLALCLCLPLAACGKKQGYDPRRYPAGGPQRLHGPDDPHAHCL